MGEFVAWSLVGLLVATAVSAVVTLVLGLRRSVLARRAANVCLALAIAVAATGTAGTIAGMVSTVAALQPEGILESDRKRIWSNGITEAWYTLSLTLFVAGTAFFVSLRVLRAKK